jgi:glucose/arabinose dehydrogenase
VANLNSVVRFAYHSGDLQTNGEPEVIVPKLTETTGGHSTRDVVFSKDGKRMFISVGSGSNVLKNGKTPGKSRLGRRKMAWGRVGSENIAQPRNWTQRGISLYAYATGVRSA